MPGILSLTSQGAFSAVDLALGILKVAKLFVSLIVPILCLVSLALVSACRPSPKLLSIVELFRGRDTPERESEPALQATTTFLLLEVQWDRERECGQRWCRNLSWRHIEQRYFICSIQGCMLQESAAAADPIPANRL
jgi:hypothetical protein